VLSTVRYLRAGGRQCGGAGVPEGGCHPPAVVVAGSVSGDPVLAAGGLRVEWSRCTCLYRLAERRSRDGRVERPAARHDAEPVRPPASAFHSELWRRDHDRVYRLTGRRTSTLLSPTL